MSDSCILSLEDQWKTKTVTANALFNETKYNSAIKEYNKAYKAEALNIHSTDCLRVNVPYVQILIISCNNIVYTFEAMGELDLAEKMLKRSVYYLLSIVNCKNSQADIIQSELKRATLAYSEFINKKGIKNLRKEKIFEHLKEEFLNNSFKV